MYNNLTQRITQTSLTFLFALVLTACGGGGNNPSSNNFSSQIISSSASSSEASSESTSSANSISSEEASTSSSSSSSSSSEAISQSSDLASSEMSSVSSFESSESSSSSSLSSSISSNQSSSSSVSSVEIAPGVTIMFPTPVSMTEQGNILVRGTARDVHSQITDLRVNGIRATTTDNFTNWRAKVTLTPGVNNLVVSTTNAAGKKVLNAGEISVKKTILTKSTKDVALDSENNRILLLDSTLKSIIAVDLVTGARSIFSHGPFVTPLSIAVDSVYNRVLILDASHEATRIVAIDLTTRARSTIAEYDRLTTFRGAITIDSGGNQAIVATSQSVSVIDLSTGEKTLLTDNSPPDPKFYLTAIKDIVLDEVQNRVLASDDGHLVAVDLLTGVSTSISGPNTPDSVPWSDLRGLALDATRNRALVLSNDSSTGDAIISVDLSNGQRTVFSNNSIPNGQNALEFPQYIAMDEINNRALVADAAHRAIIAVDLTSGQRTVLSDNNIPSGSLSTALNNPEGLAFDQINQNLIIMDDSPDILFSVNLLNSERTEIAKFDNTYGSNNFRSIVVDNDLNRVLAADLTLDAIVSIDLDSGVKSIFSAPPSGTNRTTRIPSGLALDAQNNRLLVSDILSGIHSIDLITEISSLIPIPLKLSLSTKIAYHSDRVFLTDGLKETLFSINLNNGHITEVSTNSGPNARTPFDYPSGIALDINRNRALIVDTGDIISVNLSTGARNLISKKYDNDFYRDSIAFDEANNRVFVLNHTEQSAVVIDIITGERAIVSK